MLKFIQGLFTGPTAGDESSPEGKTKSLDIQIATCGILLEMAHVDDKASKEEEDWIFNLIKTSFSLDDQAMKRLREESEKARREQVDLFEFSRTIKEHYDKPQKQELLEMVWQVVVADGKIDIFEDELVRRLTYLLGMEHHEMIEAKTKILKRRGKSL